MKKLVIAEKPSVAREIAKTLGAFERGSGYIEGPAHIVTWALGHLVELCDPAHYSERWKRWSMKELPMLPETLDQEVIESSKEQFDNIAALFTRSDISSVVIATDAGREGELVARWILKLCGWKGETLRLWISSQTEKAIKEGFAHLESASLYDNLYHAAEARSAADWYVGMNVSRALTCHYDARLSAGRVQTPTLALMTKREEEREAFLGAGYYTARADFGLFSASYYPEDNSVRFTDKETKEFFENGFEGSTGRVVSMVKEEKEEKPPLLYDLTELQRDANLTYGFSAKETLDTLQRLYEVHKIVTYPRTDSRYLTADIVPTLRDRVRALENTQFAVTGRDYLESGFDFDTERYCQEALVTDHHAIIPTEETVRPEKLSADEEKLWRLIAMRFLEALSSSYIYTTTTCTIDVKGRLFKTRLTLPVRKGWRKVASEAGLRSTAAAENLDDSFALLRMKEGDEVKAEGITVKENTTTPPERYTDATLLSAMEHAGRFVEDREIKGHLSNGLGTPATRADIIEKLVQNSYVVRDGKYFVPTAKGREVVRLAPKVLQSAELTGIWEGRLDAISRGLESQEVFIKDIKQMASGLVDEVRNSSLVFDPHFPDGKKCPHCGGEMMKSIAVDGSVHYICQRLSCCYEIREVKVPVDTSALNKVRKAPEFTASGKVKVVIKKSAVRLPKTVYETRTEVVRESKKAFRPQRDERREDVRRHSFTSSDSGGGTFADFLKQSERRAEERRRKKK
ncbi:MAG: DNA topoisomerase 3 [Bullifex sp.]